ncbi:hypothetical protein GYMLUDRAFT_64393 [Collybiopsis luxurians FD-317 M1]|uniref:Unplaced genomic scaffold GYMLUscaffold_99, whole genome shotgun sequence n=1 Tax=Collybiopsis luxurians FD-317 M1 TaxID=944289 RepID=A0A0D0CBE5_9AGAR|nr:hypothetical protein GYMLUDRAFT_64393 [Collybiopsis luxurians FD-317 M1]
MSNNSQFFPRASGFSIHDSTFVSYNGSPPNTPAVPEPCDEKGEYVRLLLPKKRGYPLWNPRPVGWQIPDAYRASGVSIGDIGIMNEFGEFDYLFNIGLPANDPVNLRRVPSDFIPLPEIRDNWAVTGSEQDRDLRPGSYIASNHAHFSKFDVRPGYSQIPYVSQSPAMYANS